MKKCFAALLLVALVVPAMADVAITNSFDNVTKNLTISFAPTDGASVRGIALTVTITGAVVDAYVSSSFNTFVDYAFSNPTGYTVGAGNPVAKETQAGVLALPIASGTPFALSVGYLTPAGQLGLTTAGTVAVLHLANINSAGGTIAITANAARGGAVVGDNIGTVTAAGVTVLLCQCYTLTVSATAGGTVATPGIGVFPGLSGSVSLTAAADPGYQFVGWTGTCVGNIVNPSSPNTTLFMDHDCTLVANFAPPETITTPSVTKTTASPAIAGRVNGGRVETFVASGAVSSLGHTLEYQFTWGDTTVGPWSVATQTHTYTYGGAGVVKTTPYIYNVMVQARCATHTAVVSAASAVAVQTSEAVKSTAFFYVLWANFNRPNCWAFQRNCRGDADGIGSGGGASKVWVNNADLTIFLSAYTKTQTQLLLINNGICADCDRLCSGGGAARICVTSSDLTCFLNYFNKPQSLVPVCPQTNYWYWTN